MIDPTAKVRQGRPLPGLLDNLDQSLAGRGSDQVLIQWAPGTTRARQIEVRDILGGELVETILTEPMKANGEGPIDVLKVPTTSSAEAIIGDYSKQPDVIYAEVNQQVSIQYVPNDAGLGSLWGLSSTGAGIKADKAWDVSKGSIKNVVGIIDSGIDYTHADLYKNVFLNQGEIKSLSWFSSLIDIDNDKLITFWDLNNSQNWNGSENVTLRLNDWNGNRYIDAGDLLDNRSGWEDGIDFDKNGYLDDLIGWDFVDNDNDPMDLNGHGTHVSGTIGAMGDNNVGVTGINFQIQMAGLRFLDATGGGYISNATKATDYFTDLKTRGLNGPDNFFATNNSWGGGGANVTLSSAITRADQAGILFIAAAGNSSTNVESYPAAYTQNNVISVAALTSTGGLASYSNYGSTWVDLGAPGSGIYSTLLNGTYGTFNGTSMAAPHVTGAAGLLATMFPTASAAQIKAALLDGTANAALAGKTLTGDQLDLTVAINNLTKAIGTTPPTPTYSIATNSASYNEGQTIAASINTTNVATGTTLYWAVTGTGIDSADFSNAALTGSGTISNGTLAFNLAIANDLKTEGTESLQIKVYSDSARTVQVTNTASISILDTSVATTPAPTPTYSIATNSASYNEGQTIAASINTTNVATGTTLYWAVTGTGIDSADFSNAALTGSGTISNGTLAFNLAIANDLKTEGTESLQIKVYSDSARTVQVTNTASISILDTSVAPVPPSTGLTLWGTNGNDVLTGGSNNDTIAGVKSTGTNLGRGQIDTLTGSTGADTFLLADARGTFYNDGNARSQGTTDYATIKDFSITDGDKIQVKGGSQYLVSFDTTAKATYFYLGNGDMRFNSADELIARFDNVNLTPGAGVWIVDNTSSLLKTI